MRPPDGAIVVDASLLVWEGFIEICKTLEGSNHGKPLVNKDSLPLTFGPVKSILTSSEYSATVQAMPQVQAETPLARGLRFLGISQTTLSGRLGVSQGRVSKLVRRVGRPAMAKRLLDAVDPERKLLTELHLLYPERYQSWEPPVSESSEKVSRETSPATPEQEPPTS